MHHRRDPTPPHPSSDWTSSPQEEEDPCYPFLMPSMRMTKTKRPSLYTTCYGMHHGFTIIMAGVYAKTSSTHTGSMGIQKPWASPIDTHSKIVFIFDSLQTKLWRPTTGPIYPSSGIPSCYPGTASQRSVLHPLLFFLDDMHRFCRHGSHVDMNFTITRFCLRILPSNEPVITVMTISIFFGSL